MTVSPVASPLPSTPSSPRISPITRLRNARHIHEQLQERKWTGPTSSNRSVASADYESPTVGNATQRRQRQVAVASHPTRQQHQCVPAANVDALAKDLQRMWRERQEMRDLGIDTLARRIEKIGAHEKDALVMHLLQQTAFLQAQRDDVVAMGEKLTTQLVQQQHELRVQFKTQTTQLHEQLQQALHHHPEVARLEDQITQLQEANRESEQKLLFAVQKLHRSRQRERELRLEHESDPLLWNL